MRTYHVAGAPGCPCEICTSDPKKVPEPAPIPAPATAGEASIGVGVERPKQKTFIGEGVDRSREEAAAARGNDALPPTHWLKQPNAWDGFVGETGEIEWEDGSGYHRFDNNIKPPLPPRK
jgi:hypothetical protein